MRWVFYLKEDTYMLVWMIDRRRTERRKDDGKDDFADISKHQC